MVIRHHAWGCLRAAQSHSAQPFSGRARQGRPNLHTLPQTLRADNVGSPVLTEPWGQEISHLHAAGWVSTSQRTTDPCQGHADDPMHGSPPQGVPGCDVGVPAWLSSRSQLPRVTSLLSPAQKQGAV